MSNPRGKLFMAFLCQSRQEKLSLDGSLYYQRVSENAFSRNDFSDTL